jgi:hypothetical protein
MRAYGARHWWPLARHAARPVEVQASVLARLLAANRSTEFAATHRLGPVTTPGEFRARVPPQDYESLRAYVDRQRLTGAPALTAEPPLFYAQTSGSTGTPKYIPITATALRFHRDEQALFTYLQHRARPEGFAGAAWGIMGAAVEGRLDSGHAVGSVSGYLYESLPRVLQSRFVVPPAVSAIADYEAKYLVILRLALAARDITYLGAPNPSTFVRLLDVLNERRDVLARSLERGSLEPLGAAAEGSAHGVDSRLRAALAPRVTAEPLRARALASDRRLTYSDLWPGIRLLTTWTGGSCGIALDALRRTLPRDCAVMELGYQATEMRGTLALETETPGGLPPLHHHFFEFVRQDDQGRADADYLGLADLVEGERYYVLVTTAAGLYRYFMNDIVEVTGRFRRTPLLRFVQKGRGVTSLTGEKLYEAQVLDAVLTAARQRGLPLAFFQLIADEAASGYHLYIETDSDGEAAWRGLGDAVDRRLGELNIEYRSKRASARLAPLVVSRLRAGSADAYKAACVAKGQREGQFKPAVLLDRKDLAWPVDRYAID